MHELISFINQPQNFIFTMSILLMIGIGFLEIILLFIGNSLNEFLPETPNLPDIGASSDISGISSFAELFAWLNQGRIPFILILISFLTSFGLIGLISQNIYFVITESLLSSWILFLPVFIISLFVVRVISKVLAKILPRDETTAIRPESFIGGIATIVNGVAVKGRQAEAKWIDRFNQTHYFQVEPVEDGLSFEKGDTVLIIGMKENAQRVFLITKDFNKDIENIKGVFDDINS